MEIFLITIQDIWYYDISVLTQHVACNNYLDAKLAMQKAIANLNKSYEAEIIKYSDTEQYPTEDDGALIVESDPWFHSLKFGDGRSHEEHTITIDKVNLQ